MCGVHERSEERSTPRYSTSLRSFSISGWSGVVGNIFLDSIILLYWRLGDCPRPTVQLPRCPLSIILHHPYIESLPTLWYICKLLCHPYISFVSCSFKSYSVWGAVVKCNIIYWCGMKWVLECVWLKNGKRCMDGAIVLCMLPVLPLFVVCCLLYNPYIHIVFLFMVCREASPSIKPVA